MKTSIIISSVAMLCLMITIAETPGSRISVNENSVPVNLVSYFTNSNSVIDDNTIRVTMKKKAAKTESLPAASNDLSYLKFDVTDYLTEEEMDIKAIEENTFDYLKFNVADYTSETAQVSSEEMELPQDNFEYLKFDVSDYNGVSEESTFDYLKFNVADYTSGDDLSSDEEIELPVNEFEYLKFDVNTCMNSEITEMPENDFSYLKFDVNHFTNEYMNSASAEEMPAADQN